MAATARVVENLGVAAYLGGATLLTDPVLLDAAGSILTIEARHQTVLNILSGTGTAIPSAFDIPFSPSEVLAVASPFITGCDLGIPGSYPLCIYITVHYLSCYPANPSLAITNTGTVASGTLLTFSSAALNGSVSTDVSWLSLIALITFDSDMSLVTVLPHDCRRSTILDLPRTLVLHCPRRH